MTRIVGEDLNYTRKVAMVLPGVGPKMADRIALKFGSWRGMVIASREEWELAVGPRRAARILVAIHGEHRGRLRRQYLVGGR